MKYFFIGRMFRLSGLFVLGILIMTSCKKDCPPISGHAVLVAGYEAMGEINYAKYWVNGTEITLSDGTNDAIANSIFSVGNNVYIAGTDGGPVYWKNNIERRLPVISAFDLHANSIFVSNNNIFVAGTDSGAVYWKNGHEVRLDAVSPQPYYPPGKHPSAANAVFVSGNDVYVSGSDGHNAVYWKNGVETTVAPGPAIGQSIVTSINVSGSDVYTDVVTFGGGRVIMVCYKNAVEIFGALGWSTQVFVTGSDVYVSGEIINDFSNGGAVYWKNGTVVNLTPNPPPPVDNYPARANSIYVAGSNVYAAGFVYNGTTDAAVYWKNGVETPLTNGTNNAIATSIFVR